MTRIYEVLKLPVITENANGILAYQRFEIPYEKPLSAENYSTFMDRPDPTNVTGLNHTFFLRLRIFLLV